MPGRSQRSTTTYQASAAYNEYKAGLDGKRWPDLPAFAQEENVIQIPAGEVFCRTLNLDGSMCPADHVWLPNNLRNHVKNAHRTEINQVHAGSTSMQESLQLINYYTKAMEYIKKESEEWPTTPVKFATSVTKKKAVKEVSPEVEEEEEEESEEEELLDISEICLPRTKISNIGWLRARNAVLAKDKKSCESCARKGVECFIKEPLVNTTCEIWLYWIGKSETAQEKAGK